MELRHLRYFVALAEELHFSRAAARLGISQPPLSQQIQALEEELGARLLHRTNRRVDLTEAGRLFLIEARATLAQAERAADMAGRAQRGEIGELKLGFTASAPFTVTIPKMIFAFRQAFPAVHLTLQEMTTKQQIEAMTERRLHVGFIRSPVYPTMPSELKALELFREPLVAILRANHPLTAGDPADGIALSSLAAEPFVMHPRAVGTGLHDQIIALCQQAGFSPRVSQEAREAPTIVGLVAAGLGVTILPSSFRRIRVEGVAYRDLADQGAMTAMWLAYPEHDLSPATRAFVDLVAAHQPVAGQEH